MKEFSMNSRVAGRHVKSGAQDAKYYSVEFSIMGSPFVYQFKIWDTPLHEKCVFVKEDSDFLNYLKAGDILDVKYYSTDVSQPIEYLKTKINHIGKEDRGRFRGLYSVRLSIVDTTNPN